MRLNLGKQTASSNSLCVIHKATGGTLIAICLQLNIFLISGHGVRDAQCRSIKAVMHPLKAHKS